MPNIPLSRPKAVVFEQHCKSNIKSMQNKAQSAGAVFRPHFKTHQSLEIGQWFRDEGVTGITVSTPEMAKYFASDSWDDITIGFPFYSGQIHEINELTNHCSLKLFVHRPEDVRYLATELTNPVSIFIEINAGYGRSGVNIYNSELIREIIKACEESQKTRFYGFYIHDGDTYKVHGSSEVESVIKRDFSALNNLKKNWPDASVSLGDTPSCSLLNEFPGIDELTPGNLVFYDLMQVNIGSCTYSQVGLLIKAPVAQLKPKSNECIIHGGAVHFSKDNIHMDGKQSYGQPVTVSDNGKIKPINGSSLVALSQEHGTVTGLKELQNALGKNELEEIWICPVHSCLTANLFKEYHTYSGSVIGKKVLS
ncbi:hypothetical protein DYD21_06220 [Rhodohalobacter sp. SW132]|uniref:alanine racemase n=1 Tax=Rhodohalobacter sp. SW132 TaxID=2293433 RepID=UPI000E22D7FB|nr:alanine racemase [Rhodohalobacter sp. SW132]REL38201.1 hypothetical protein DYD21_06220 [Rhodohalobacter sp. SW132]